MNRPITIGLVTASLAIGAVAGAVALPAARAQDDATTLVLVQEAPELTMVDVGEQGHTVGDLLIFEARVSGEGGESGVLHGTAITADLTDPGDAESAGDRLDQMTFDLGNGDGIVVAGKILIPDGEREMAMAQPTLRAVVGGTGRFMGARGQVESVRQEDLGYRHTFTLLDVD